MMSHDLLVQMAYYIHLPGKYIFNGFATSWLSAKG